MRIATLAPLQAGKAVDRHGLPVTVRLNGEVETWWREGALKTTVTPKNSLVALLAPAK